MLPKPEKITKKNNSEQLNFIDPLEEEKRIKRKRKTVIILLLLTVGSSFTFWTYRYLETFFTNFSLSPIKFNLSLPQVNIPSKKTDPQFELNNQIQRLLSGQNQKWTIYVQALESATPYSWSYNTPNNFIDNLNNVISETNTKNVTNTSLISEILPPGVQIQENILNQPESFEYYYIISVPNQKIFIAFKINDLNELEESKKTIPLLAEKIYWQFMKQN